jgi:hypothetical protein
MTEVTLHKHCEGSDLSIYFIFTFVIDQTDDNRF